MLVWFWSTFSSQKISFRTMPGKYISLQLPLPSYWRRDGKWRVTLVSIVTLFSLSFRDEAKLLVSDFPRSKFCMMRDLQLRWSNTTDSPMTRVGKGSISDQGHKVRRDASKLIFLIHGSIKLNIKVSGWLYQSKIHMPHFVYQENYESIPLWLWFR